MSQLEIPGGDRVVALRVHAAGMPPSRDLIAPGDEEPRAAVVGEAKGTAAAQDLPRP